MSPPSPSRRRRTRTYPFRWTAAVIAVLAASGCSRGCGKSQRTAVPAGTADGVVHAHAGTKPTDPITMTLTPRERSPIAPGSPSGNPGAELLVEAAARGGMVVDDRDLYWYGPNTLWRLPKGTRTSVAQSLPVDGQLAVNDSG